MNFRLICGKNAVKSVLESGYNVDRILISETVKNCESILNLAKSAGVVVKFVNPFKMKQFPNCQGVVAYASNLHYFTLEEVLKQDVKIGKAPFFLICDRVFDPHNLGALIRTAVAAGVSGVIISKRGCCPLSATVEKSSAGAINFVRLIRVSNLGFAVDYLKKCGVFVYCADLSGKEFFKHNLTGAVALVVGSEGEGVSCLIKKKSDGVLTIPMAGGLNSLNVSVAGGILMFEIAKQRGFKAGR